MTSFNRITLIGPLHGSPDRRVTDMGEPMLRLSVITDRPASGDQTPQKDTIPVVGWGNVAALGDDWVAGQVVLIEGRIQVKAIDDAAGQRRWITEVVASDIKALPSTSMPTIGMSPSGFGNHLVSDSGIQSAHTVEHVALDSVDIPFEFKSGAPKSASSVSKSVPVSSKSPVVSYEAGPNLEPDLDEIPF